MRGSLNITAHLFVCGLDPLFHVDPPLLESLVGAFGLFGMAVGHIDFVLVHNLLQDDAGFDCGRRNAGDRDDIGLFGIAAGIASDAYRQSAA